MWTPAVIKSPSRRAALGKAIIYGNKKLQKKFLILLAGAGFPLFTLAGGPGGIFQKPFLGRRRQRRRRQSAILLPASHDTIGHYWTSGSADFNSLPNQRHFCHFQILEPDDEEVLLTRILTIINN